MTLHEDVFAALTAGSPTALRAYPEVLPQQVTLPAVTFTVVGGDDDFTLLGPSGLARKLLQVDTWAGTRLSADSLMVEVQSLLLASVDFQINAIDETGGVVRYESDTRRYRASREFTLWLQT